MSSEVLVALITGGFALIGTWVTVWTGNKKILSEMEKNEALQDERISTLTKTVEKHNNVLQRLYVAEGKIDLLMKKGNN